MTTSKQIAANRKNALVSTGPKSPNGKSAVASNAVKLGVYSLRPVVDEMESVTEWEEFRAGILDDLAPVGALEQALAERVAGCLWRVRRVTRYESDVIETNRKDWVQFITPADASILSALVDEGKQISKAKETVESAKARLDHWEEAAKFFERMAASDTGDPVDGKELHLCLWEVSKEILSENDDLEIIEFLGAAEFLKAVRPPLQPKDESDPWKRPAWTIEHARRAFAHLMTFDVDGPCSLDELCRNVLEESRRKLAQAEKRQMELAAAFHAREVRAVAARSMPDDKEAATIARYESHLSRQMTQALHGLQRLQAARAGVVFLPPATLDVTIHGPDGGEGPAKHDRFAKQSQLKGCLT